MRIGWVTPSVNLNGAVREMVEISNAFISRRHQVTIYHSDGAPCEWLPCKAMIKRLSALPGEHNDVLIGLSDWQRDMHKALDAADANVKCICVVGFRPTQDLANAWTGKLPVRDVGEELQKLSIHKYYVLTDSSWQREWLYQNTGVKALPPFGGVNLEQFHPVPQQHRQGYLIVGASGDPRTRKGGDIVMRAWRLIRTSGLPVRFATYWHQGIAQDKMRDWYSNCDVFIDAERVAGWANPVAEAMACGAPVVSTDIGAVHDFAINGQTALLVPIDDAEGMAGAAIRLLKDADLRKKLSQAGLVRIRQFAYPRVVEPLERALQELVSGSSRSAA